MKTREVETRLIKVGVAGKLIFNVPNFTLQFGWAVLVALYLSF